MKDLHSLLSHEAHSKNLKYYFAKQIHVKAESCFCMPNSERLEAARTEVSMAQ